MIHSPQSWRCDRLELLARKGSLAVSEQVRAGGFCGVERNEWARRQCDFVDFFEDTSLATAFEHSVSISQRGYYGLRSQETLDRAFSRGLSTIDTARLEGFKDLTDRLPDQTRPEDRLKSVFVFQGLERTGRPIERLHACHIVISRRGTTRR